MIFVLAFASLLVLVILHELGHFFFARRFGVKVEEFGIGLPPRVWGKKWGETLISLNLIPLGAFVKMEGEEEESTSQTSFARKPVWQRFCIVAGGVGAFWVIAMIIFTILGATSGIPLAVSDDKEVASARVQIIGVAPDSPAKEAGLKAGDMLTDFNKVQELQEKAKANAGKEMPLNIQRGSAQLTVALIPRENPPVGQGAIGIALARIGLVKYAWYEAPLKGVEITYGYTAGIVAGVGSLASSLFTKAQLPEGAQITGPIGVLTLLRDSFSLGVPYFISFVALLSIYLAVFNTLPIPALDGGRMLFLLIEAVRRKPLSQKVIKNAITISFAILLGLMIWVTIQDLGRLF